MSTIPYESAVADEPKTRRPLWVYAVVAVYALIVAGLALMPMLLPLLEPDSLYPPLIATTLALVLCELALLFVPVRVASRRPVTRRSLWVPLLGSAFLAALLAFGGSFALAEWLGGTINFDVVNFYVIFGATGAVWLAWTLVFWALSYDRPPDAIAVRLHRWLLAGSVLELLIAVPTHVVVRRRDECCAGIGTGMGICAGIIVMLLGFGPSVAFLYYKRWKQIRRP